MTQLFANNAGGTLSAGINSTATSIVLSSGQGALFPSPTSGDFFKLTLTQAATETSWEIVCIVARTADTLTVGVPGSASANVAGRGYDSTSAATWATSDKADHRVTAADLKAGTNALYSATTTVNVSSAAAPTAGQALVATSGTAATWQTPAVAVGGITGLGTGVGAALAANVGSAGAPVLFNGAGGTPSSMTATNLTGTASGLTAGSATYSTWVYYQGDYGDGASSGSTLGIVRFPSGVPYAYMYRNTNCNCDCANCGC
jgi:hypothetical protein